MRSSRYDICSIYAGRHISPCTVVCSQVTIHAKAVLPLIKDPGRAEQTTTLTSDGKRNDAWSVLEFTDRPGSPGGWYGRLHCFITVEGSFTVKFSGVTYRHTIDERKEAKHAVVSWFRPVPDGDKLYLVSDATRELAEHGAVMYEYDLDNRDPQAIAVHERLIGKRYFQGHPRVQGNRPTDAVWFDLPWAALNDTSTDPTASDGAYTHIIPLPMPPITAFPVETAE